MNKELYDAIENLIKDMAKEKKEIINNYNNQSIEVKRELKANGQMDTAQRRVNQINSEMNELKSALGEIDLAVEESKKARKENEIKLASVRLCNANETLYELADRYGIIYDRNNEAEVKNNNEEKTYEVKKVKNHSFINSFAGALAALTLFGIAYGVVSCNKKDTQSKESSVIEEVIKNNNKKENSEVSTNLQTKLTDASDEKQVMARAQEIFDKYVNTKNAGDATFVELSPEKLANTTRICNGEFMLDNGKPMYNSSNIIEAANTICSYANSTSYVSLKNNLEYKPMSVFFDEDTIGYKVVCKNDELMSEIYEDIKKNDVEKFRTDSIKWGEFIRDTFIYNDFNQDVISIYSVEDKQKYEVAVSLLAQYESTIGEYSRNIAINNPKFSICIPYCVNGTTGKTNEISLSKLVYDISDTKINSLAERAGMKAEWDKNNDPILIQCLQYTQNYFNDKYDREVGHQLTLSR